MFGVIKKIFGTKHDKDIKKMMPTVEKTNEFYKSYQNLTNDELREKTNEFKARIASSLSEYTNKMNQLQAQIDETDDLYKKEEIFKEYDKVKEDKNVNLEKVLLEILPEAFAVVKETASRFTNNSELEVTTTEHDREMSATKNYVLVDGDKTKWKNSWTAAGGDVTWNMIHYDVQLIGGIVLHEGKIAEMQTGEGKTLVATLPLYLNALAGEGVHLVTVNDYLARRDSEWIGPIMEFLFLTIDCIDKYQPHSADRINAYNCDITYGTNNEFGFDYLRDNMIKSIGERVQRAHHYAIVDEVDSVLVDDARTPLIISGPVPKGTEEQEYEQLKPKIEALINVQKKQATAYLAEAKKLFAEGKMGYNEGEVGLPLLRAFRSMPKYRPLIKFLSQEGVKVELQKAENFYMQEQSKHMHIVDEPLYYTIEEKTRQVELVEKGAELLSKGENDPEFFIMPDIGVAMQEMEQREKEEQIDLTEEKEQVVLDFSIKARRLHTVNQLLKAYSLFIKDEDYVVIDDQVKIVDESTGRMMEGRRYSDGLHQALEAKEQVEIGDITQTYATVTLQNYFRMHHKLAGMTGTAETEAGEFWEIYKLDVVVIPTNRPIVRDDKEDLVFKTAKEKFNAVIEEIDGLIKEGRPVLVGTTSVDISEKLSRMMSMRSIDHNVLNAKQHQREAQVVTEAGLPGKVTIATNMAGRGTDIKLSDEVKASGGLAIIATERHDSRRVDRQLRGRAGRQGDPGSSQFFVSLEDNLMRLFHSERIAKLMDKMGHKEGEVIQHSMVSKSIGNAQKKVEENNYGTRKRLLEYDDVMNIQREAIYSKRDNALSGERLSIDLHNMFLGLIGQLVVTHKSNGDFESFRTDCIETIGIDPKLEESEFNRINVNDLSRKMQDDIFELYQTKSKHIQEVLLPVIANVYENEGHKYKRIAVPFTDGRVQPLDIAADLKEAIDTDGATIMKDIEKTIALALIDENWKEHLRAMDELKESVQAASFEQKDPLVIYKMEAFNLFQNLINNINRDVCSYLMKGKLLIEAPEDVQQARERKSSYQKLQTSRMSQNEQNDAAMRKAAENAGREPQKIETFKRDGAKVGRNDPCPCGSGKKYKKCHGMN